MTTDAWRALKRERRRRVCRGIRQTFLLVMGVSIAALVVYHLIWFRYGWTDLPLRCADEGWGEWREIYGELTPQVAASFERLLTTLYGEDAVKRPQPGRIVVRPVVVIFGDDGRLRDLTIMMTGRLANPSRSALTRYEDSKGCRLVQQELMARGRGNSCESLWQAELLRFPVNQADTPWLTRFFRVAQPAPGLMDNLPPDAFPRPGRWLKPVDSDRLPDGVECGPSLGHKVYFGSIAVVADILQYAESLWLF
jgi:hypothetical protein